ncbi:hypothetical protein [Leptospira sp. id769339]|uniref:hypothetical protein n=1 Tax=Leptospira sp. id769339 TaxID=2864221 RepID=UPI00214BF85E|nr:hypothetical protein [Leptospira sp. id769339]MCR1795689.1 hypothetical protein [Leptospira sp. id769339]
MSALECYWLGNCLSSKFQGQKECSNIKEGIHKREVYLKLGMPKGKEGKVEYFFGGNEISIEFDEDFVKGKNCGAGE